MTNHFYWHIQSNLQFYNYSRYKRMEDQIDEILKNSKKQGEKIAISNLRHKPRGQTKVVDEETLTRLKNLKKYALQDSSIPTEKLNNYYCSLCGRINLITNILIENLPKRKTDGSIAIELKGNFLKLHLQRDRIKYFMREKGLETYYRWKCDCGMPIGYTAITYEEFQEARMNQNFVCSNRAYFYAYPDSLVQKMKESKVISELITYKQTILLHLKRKTKK